MQLKSPTRHYVTEVVVLVRPVVAPIAPVCTSITVLYRNIIIVTLLLPKCRKSTQTNTNKDCDKRLYVLHSDRVF